MKQTVLDAWLTTDLRIEEKEKVFDIKNYLKNFLMM